MVVVMVVMAGVVVLGPRGDEASPHPAPRPPPSAPLNPSHHPPTLQAALRSLGIDAEHVPLGFVQSMSDLLPQNPHDPHDPHDQHDQHDQHHQHDPASSIVFGPALSRLTPPGGEPQLDVLFYGTSTPVSWAGGGDVCV